MTYQLPALPVGSRVMQEAKQAVINAFIGDTIIIEVYVELLGEPVTYVNSILEFALKDQKFTIPNLWEATWRHGIELKDGRPGRVVITIPKVLSADLRRGSYVFSLRCSDPLSAQTVTVLNGTLQMDCTAVSDNNVIPYREDPPVDMG